MLQIKSFTFSPIAENTYVLFNEHKNAIIIDPGCYYDNEKDALKDWITEKKLTVTHLLNTHCHLDHVFGNKFVAETYSLHLHMHPLETPVLDYATTSGLNFNLPFDNYTGQKIFLTEGQHIQLNDDSLQVIHTPGHSPGSVSFYCAAQHFIISGDVLFRQSVGRTDLPGGDFNILAQSIKTKLYNLPTHTSVHSGHGEATTIGYEMRNNPYVNA
jgi:hydroxyacylglutathione hydrolase